MAEPIFRGPTPDSVISRKLPSGNDVKGGVGHGFLGKRVRGDISQTEEIIYINTGTGKEQIISRKFNFGKRRLKGRKW